MRASDGWLLAVGLLLAQGNAGAEPLSLAAREVRLARLGELSLPVPVTLRLWPLGHVEGTLRVADPVEKLPASVQLQTVPVPAILGRPPLPPGAFECPVDDKGRFRCTLPAATFDLVVVAPDFVPHYFWLTPVEPAKVRALGTLRLERGASLAGWVTAEVGKIDPAQARVRLTPAADCAGAEGRLQASRLTVGASVNAEGFFQFRGLAPGAYAVEASQPGLASASESPFLVEPGRETRLARPLALARPLELEVRVTPPLDPRERPWTAWLARRNATGPPTTTVLEGELGPDGRVVAAGQGPGLYAVTVLDAEGQRWVDHPHWQVSGSAEAALDIVIEAVKVEGRLQLGDEPLAGALWFGGRQGSERLKLEADAEGVFAGVLPRAGRWWLEVESTEPALAQRRWVDVVPRGDGRAELVVRVPATLVTGIVVDADGRPAEGAKVYALGAEPAQDVRADRSGRFELRGAEPGPLVLVATKGSRASRRREVTLPEGEPLGSLELRLEAPRALAGKVLGPYGPVAGASLVATPEELGHAGASATSAADGSFTLELGASVRLFALVARAPGLGTEILRVDREVLAEALTVALRPEQGTLRVRLGGLGAFGLSPGRKLVLRKDGPGVSPVLLAPQSLREERLASGIALLSLPGLAPGVFEACLVGTGLTASETEARCDAGFLSADGELVLRLEVGE